MFRLILLIWVLYYGFVSQGYTQGSTYISTAVQRKILVTSPILIQDTLTIIPSSVYITVGSDTITGYTIHNTDIFLSDDLFARYKSKIISIAYRRFAFNVGKPVVQFDSLKMRKDGIFIPDYILPLETDITTRENKGENVRYRGTFARGLSVGNNQSFVLNSNFDMQIIGDLGNGLKITGAITDQNLPIQAQGNTQQLQEFDRVFIQLSKGNASLTAGDFELPRPEKSYFVHYFKKLKGIKAEVIEEKEKNSTFSSRASFAISRGKFARQFLSIQEGNQGPYRLNGNNNEQFIIVLSGTEKVYFNGKLLTRGFDYDYIIDYNKAEITFSPTRLISWDSRVIIEFEYTDINYLRSLYTVDGTYKTKKLDIGLHMYSEQDSKNLSGEQILDSTDVDILAQAGDNLQSAVRRSISPIDFTNNNVTNTIVYKGRIDTTLSKDIILEYTENQDSAAYIAIFSEVGLGQGDYDIDNNKVANGRVYKYVGKNNGRYMPIVRLIPPEQKQIMAFTTHYKLSEKSNISTEIALSHLDINRRSSINDNDNLGAASKMFIDHAATLDSAGTWIVKWSLLHEYVHKNFNALNPFRSPEFIRDWNTTLLTERGNENIILSQIKLNKGLNNSFQYTLNTYGRQDIYKGIKHTIEGKWQVKRWNGDASVRMLNSTAHPIKEKTQFVRPNIKSYYSINNKDTWRIGFEYDGETNVRKASDMDTLVDYSYDFHILKLYLWNDLSSNIGTKIGYNRRIDYVASTGFLNNTALSEEWEWGGKIAALKTSQIHWNFTYRQLDVYRPELLQNTPSKKSVLGRIDYGGQYLKQALRINLNYNTNSGQEPRLEYIFRQVEPGQGDYVYIGSSAEANTSNIQDFRLDPTNPLASYIRLTLNNNEFIKTNNVEFNQNIQFEPQRLWATIHKDSLTTFKHMLSKISFLSNNRMNKKVMDTNESAFSDYFNFSSNDPTLVLYNLSGQHTLFIQRGHIQWDAQLGRKDAESTYSQINGLDRRKLSEYFVKARWALWNRTDIFLQLDSGSKIYESEVLPERNLYIQIRRIRPELNFRPTTQSRLVFKYSYQDKKQTIESLDKALIHDISIEGSWRKANTFGLDVSASYVSIAFSGLANSPLEFDMLEGLKNGKNMLWNVIFTRRLESNIDLTLNYEGRKTGILPSIHVARVQLKATF